MAHLVLALLWGVNAAPVLRSCHDADWRFAFGKCREDTRNVYPYVRFCKPDAPVAPLLDVPCKQSCPAGQHLGVKMKNSRAQLQCIDCPAGKFSLGGGLLISGVAGDWHKSWPVGLRSSCSYQLPDGSMQHGKGSTTGLSGTCEMQILAPEAVAGKYLIRALLPARPARAGRLQAPVARLLLAPGDRRLCTRPKRSELSAFGHPRLLQSKTRQRPMNGRGPGGPHAQAAPLFRHFWLLAVMGGCPISTKASAAAAIGAEGVLLAAPAAVAFGAGDMYRPPNRSGTRNMNLTRLAASFVMLEDRDSQLLASGISTLQEGILINNTAMHACAAVKPAARRPRTPVTPGLGAEPVEFGCEPWVPDELGTSIHSGENHNFNRVVSTLELMVNIVREHGYVLFRYQVDSEEGYDGLRFEVDWSEALPQISRQLTWRELRVNLTQGSHFLRWQYVKDSSDAGGMDRAQLQLVQVIGTSFSDLECFHCHGSGTHSAGGADHCNACGPNQYLVHDGADLSQCRPCPAGRWSMPGTVGVGSCMALRNCTERDVKVSLTTCIKGKQQQKRSWLEPVRCDVNATGAHSLLSSGKIQPCTACEPNTARASSGTGACRPKSLTCPAGEFSVTQLVLENWDEWPLNLSQQVITATGEELGNDTIPGGWKLRPNQEAGIGIERLILGELESRLHLDVKVLLSPGRLEFILEVSPQSEWGSDVQFLLDNVEASHVYGLQMNRSSTPRQWRRIQVSAPLYPGLHRLTWRCLYPVQGDTSNSAVRLKRVSVEGVEGGGAIRCQGCPPAQEVVRPEGTSCQSCRAGFYFKEATRRCQICPPGFFAAAPGATQCTKCPKGTYSVFGRTCTAKVMLTATDKASKAHAAEQVVFNASAAIQHWKQTTTGLNGPFLVAGRKFLIDVERPIESDEGQAFFWELRNQACGSNVSSLMSITAPVAAPQALATPIGIYLSAVEAVANENVRGVRFSWVKSPGAAFINTTNPFDLKATLKNIVACPAGMAAPAEALLSASLLLRCDATAPLKSLARKDANGNIHLDGLRVAGSALPKIFGCGRLDLEWPTLMACPPCQVQDFAAQRTACDNTGWRTVSFKQMRPCVGGMRAPPGYQETCDGKDVRSVVKGMGQTVKKKYPILALFFATATLLLGCILLCYATQLHRKYRQRFLQDGGL